MLWDAEGHFPGGQLQLLAHQVEAGLNGFPALGKLGVCPAQSLDRSLPLLPGRPRPRNRHDRGSPGPGTPRLPPVEVALPAIRTRLHRGLPSGLFDRLGHLRRRGTGATCPGHRGQSPRPRRRIAPLPRSRSRGAVTSDRTASLVQSSRNASDSSASASTTAVALHPSPLTQLKVLLTGSTSRTKDWTAFWKSSNRPSTIWGPGIPSSSNWFFPIASTSPATTSRGIAAQPRADPNPERRLQTSLDELSEES